MAAMWIMFPNIGWELLLRQKGVLLSDKPFMIIEIKNHTFVRSLDDINCNPFGLLSNWRIRLENNVCLADGVSLSQQFLSVFQAHAYVMLPPTQVR